jgi:recombinational DNA repair ATPase RecF
MPRRPAGPDPEAGEPRPRDPAVRSAVESRLAEVGDDGGARSRLILAALDGATALEAELAGGRGAPRAQAAAPTPTPVGAFLQSITAEGFRGIGPAQTLELRPGPGLTLVVGRNGSGKSSFAEAIEVLLTGDSMRWKERAAVWREGWRNLHHPSPSLTATFLVEGGGPCRVSRRWPSEAAFEAGDVAARLAGGSDSDLDALGWAAALRTHRPFLSYNELGSLLDEGPSKLYDALSSILGLEDLVEALEALRDARRAREKGLKEATDARKELLEALGGVDDPRARQVATAIEGREWDLDAVAGVLGGAPSPGARPDDLDVLRRVASLEPPDPARVAAAAAELRGAAAEVKSLAGSVAARSRDAAALLEHALSFHAEHGDGDCPVCGKGALDAAWSKRQRDGAAKLREAAGEAEKVGGRAEAARRGWEELLDLKGDALRRAAGAGLDLGELVAALEAWTRAGSISDLDELADHLESASGPLHDALARLRDAARAELGRKEDAWRPVAAEVAAWLAGARDAMSGSAALADLKAAEAWLKKAAAGIRDDRFGPIAEKAAGIWERLRQQSHVELGRIQLAGEGTRRRVTLDVTVDGVEGAALGVMSQGELHSLALSLFVPRATLPESPFRFIVIDDPVQSMDPARVDGLARVLESASAERQVVVFTHDDRLPEAVRRLDVPAEIVEVTRRDASVVELRRALDPVGRYLEDALAVAGAELPSSAAAHVVPGLCRLALEAACMEVVRRRRLGRGEPHGEVERALMGAGLNELASLAVFDDAGRETEVEARVRKEAGQALAGALSWSQSGDGNGAEPVELIRHAGKLVAWLRGLK